MVSVIGSFCEVVKWTKSLKKFARLAQAGFGSISSLKRGSHERGMVALELPLWFISVRVEPCTSCSALHVLQHIVERLTK